MNILMITYNPTGRGTYFRAYEFARELIKLNQSVTLLSVAPKRHTRIQVWFENGIQIAEFPALIPGAPRSGWDPYTIITRIKWLNNKDFDIVHGFESRPTIIYPLLYLKQLGIPIVLDWCDWFGKFGSVEERPNPILRNFLRPIETYYENHFRTFADATTVICKTLSERALSFGVKPNTLSLIPNGFNMPGWDNHISSDIARKKLGLTNDQFVIGYVGSLLKIDAKLMTDAFRIIHNQLPRAHLLHLGHSNYQPEFQSMKPGMITITGKINEDSLRSGLAACDLCWLPLSDNPANWGRFPLKFSTYLAMGKPIIVTDVGDIPCFVRKYQVGLTTAPNAQGLSEVILKIASDQQTLGQYAENSRLLSKDPQHSWQKRTSELLEVYRQLSK